MLRFLLRKCPCQRDGARCTRASPRRRLHKARGGIFRCSHFAVADDVGGDCDNRREHRLLLLLLLLAVVATNVIKRFTRSHKVGVSSVKRCRQTIGLTLR